MPLSPRPSNNFQTDAFNFIEPRETTVLFVYGDGEGVPTIGVGYALVIRGANGWAVKATLDSDLLSIGITLTQPQRTVLAQIVQELNRGNIALANTFSDQLGDQAGPDDIRVITPAEARTLFDLELGRAVDQVRQQFRAILNPTDGDALHASLLGSEEMIALTSLAYNAPSLIGPRLTQALWSGDRAEAWFEIRYRSNALGSTVRNGIAQRRYAEAAQFGLYNANPTETDFMSAYRMYTKYRSANIYGRVGLIGYETTPGFIAPPATIETALEPARFGLGTEYGVPNVGWENIFVGGSGVGTGDVDLIFGEASNDTIVAGAGNDVLVGSAGHDVLRGGAGNDAYFFRSGDGADEIDDSDGLGSVRMGGLTVSGTGAQGAGGSSLYREWVEHVAGQTLTYRLHYVGLDAQGALISDLSITSSAFAAGDRVVIKNYEDGDLGINLTPSAALSTILGVVAANPYGTPGYAAGTPNATLGENSSLEFGVASNRPAGAAERWRFEISGTGGERAQLLTGAETLSFVNGAIEVTLTAGQSLSNFSLLSFGDFDSDEQVTLTVTQVDAQGTPIGTSATMNVLFDAIDEQTPTPAFTLSGDIAPNVYNDPGSPDHNRFIFSPWLNGAFLGNVIEGTASPGRADRLIGTPDPDALYGLGGTDAINGRAGDDFIDGGDGDDWLTGGLGVDRIFGGSGDDLIMSGASIQPIVTAYSTDPNPEAPLPPSSSYTLVATGWNWYLVRFTSGVLGVSPAGGLSILQTTADLTDDAGDIVDAGDGNDTVDGGYGDDVIQGGAGDDQLRGGPGSDRIEGGLGNDRVLGDSSLPWTSGETFTVTLPASDFIDGGAGDDVIYGEEGNDTLLGGADDDILDGGDPGDVGGNDFLDGGDGNDALFGGDYDDVLYGGAGDDTLQADDYTELDGADYLNGEDGNDTLFGGGRADTLIGGAGNDELFGESSSVFSTLHGDDFLDGGDGDDTLHGRGGADTLIGGAGVDTLYGDLQTEVTLYGNDFLAGGAGADILVGAGGSDTLEGGDDDDQLYGDSSSTPAAVHGADQIDGGAGNDTIVAGGGDDSARGGDGDDVLFGDDGSDYLRGDAGNDYLAGDDGADTLQGGDGSDTLYGGAGNDLLVGGLGADHLDGGAGDDTYQFSAADLAPVNGLIDGIVDSSGNDVVVFDASLPLGDLVLTSPVSGELRIGNTAGTAFLSIGGLLSGTSSVRSFRFASGEVLAAHQLVSQLYSQPVSTSSAAPSAYVVGGSQADVLTGSGEGAVISGGAGDDVLTGGQGASTTYLFTRGDGNDFVDDLGAPYGAPNTLSLTDVFQSELSLQYRPGVDTRLVVSNGGGSIALSTFGVADVIGVRTIDTIEYVDAELTQTWAEFVAAHGVDIIAGPASGAIVDGTNVDDRMVGWVTGETINAGAGNDTIDGGEGNDTLDGGAGSDTYLFEVGSGQDVINNADTVAGKTDRLIVGLERNQALLIRYEDSLIVRAAASADRVIVTNYFAGAGLDEVGFADGTVYTPANVVLDPPNSQVTTGDDDIFGTPGDDTIDALAGADSLFGGSGNDTLEGNDGNDVLRGEGGNDNLSGGAGTDTLYGGDGDDVLTGALTDFDTMYGEAGNDQLAGRGILDGGAGDDQITGNHTLIGGDGNDVLTAGGDALTSLSGGAGNDQLIGTAASNEAFSGGDGDDLLDGGGGSADTFDGGAGSDTIVVRRGGGTVYITQDDAGVGRLDTLRFGPDILPSQVTFSADRFGSLTLQVDQPIGLPSVSVVIYGYLDSDTATKKFDRVIFDADPGTVWTNAQLEAFAMTPSSQNQYFRGSLGNDVLNGLGGVDYLHGRDGDDQLAGGSGDDELFGEDGADQLSGGTGNDELDGGVGSDVYAYNIGDGNDQIQGTRDGAPASVDAIVFGPGINPGTVTVRRGVNSNDDILLTVLDPVTGAALGSIEVLNGFASFGTEILDEVRFTDVPGTVWTNADLQQLLLSGGSADDLIVGFTTGDLIRGNGGNDRMDGAAGNDDLAGGPGNDALIGGMGDDTFRFGHGQGFDEIADTSGVNRIVLDVDIVPADVVLYRTSSTTTLHPGFLPTKNADGLALVLNGTGEQLWVRNFFSGQTPRAISEIAFADGTIWNAALIDANVVNQGGTANSASGTAANDNYTVDHPNDTITEASGGGTDSVSSSVTYTLPANIENLTLSGVLNTNATGNTLVNTLTGNAADNYLHGGGSVSSPDGADTLIGGDGNDTYEVLKDPAFGANTFNDIVIETSNGGYDTLIVRSHSAALPNNVEALAVRSFSGSFTATMQIYQGNAGDDLIDGRSATLTGYGFKLDGGAGADVMIGPSGSSFGATVDRIFRYVVDNVGDVVIGSSSSGPITYDLVQSSVDYVMPDSVERLELTGSAAISGTGNALANYLNGATSSGANVLAGGAGDDEYTLGAGDTVVESAGEGTDTVVATVAGTFDLAQLANIENLGASDAAGAVTLLGNGIANVLAGNASANMLAGGAGDDSLVGAGGNDRYSGFGVGSGADVIIDTAGTDTVEFASSQNTQIEQLTLAQVGNNLQIGISAQDSVTIQSWFAGSANAVEALELWEDGLLYRYTKAQIDAKLAGTNSAPVVNATPATPQAMATQPFSWVLPGNTFADVESQHSLTYAATLSDGSGLPSWLSFDGGTRTFSGTPGSANLGAVSVRVTATDAGALATPVVFSIFVSPFVLYGTAGDDTLIGDSGDNVVYGLAGNDTIEGLDGADDLNGDEGDDTIHGDAGDDILGGGDGNDFIYGGANDDFIDAGDGNDLLDGGAGADVLFGELGDDTYVVDSAGDFVEELAGEGIDTIQSSITYTLGAELENLTLTGTAPINGTGNGLNNVITGNSVNNTLSGGAGNDILDGGAGNDAMSGGQGNDSFYVDSTSDTVTESSGQGTDTVHSSLSTYTLPSNVENLVLLGTGNLNGTGNSAANTLTGNSGNNTLSGGTGADTMLGGAGNDTYVVDNTGDVVTENTGEGTDLVQSSVTYTISDVDVENLTLTGTSAINGTGNSSDNILTGNSANNTLTGAGGNDTLNGGSGSDTMIGGQGDDTYVVAQTGDVVTETANEGTDLVQSSITYTLGNNVENLTLTGTTAINGTGNALDNVITGNSANNTLTGNAGNDTLNGGGGTDTMSGGLGDDVYYVDVSGDVTTESAGQGIDTVSSSITRTLASNIEILFLTGTSAINGTGNALANLLRGNTAINTLAGAGGTDIVEGGGGSDVLSNTSGNTLLNGGADNDTLTGTGNNDLLIGGLGDDSIATGQGADIIVFNQGEGQDTVAASTTQDNVLALGGGILYADLLFQKSGNNLILKTGGTDQITFTNFYASASNRSVDRLQIVIEGTSDYDSGSGDALRNKKIATFDFDGLVAAFDAALIANPGLTTWALTNALVAQHLGGSDTAAIGGDLAYRYGRFDTLSDISFTPAAALLAAAGFGTAAQTLQSLGTLQDSSARLS